MTGSLLSCVGPCVCVVARGSMAVARPISWRSLGLPAITESASHPDCRRVALCGRSACGIGAVSLAGLARDEGFGDLCSKQDGGGGSRCHTVVAPVPDGERRLPQLGARGFPRWRSCLHPAIFSTSEWSALRPSPPHTFHVECLRSGVWSAGILPHCHSGCLRV